MLDSLLVHAATCTKANLYCERPHELKDEIPGGAELKHLLCEIDSTWCIEYCVELYLEPFLKAIAAFGWTGARTYDQ